MKTKPSPTSLPIIYPYPKTGWCDTVPQYIKAAIIEQRKQQVLNGDFEEYATDAEILLILYCLSLTAPLQSEYVDIYMYVLTKVFKFLGIEVPEEIRKEKLSPDLERELLRMKKEIRTKTLKKRR